LIYLSDRGSIWGGWEKEEKEGEQVTCLVAKAERDRRRNVEEVKRRKKERESVFFIYLFTYLFIKLNK